MKYCAILLVAALSFVACKTEPYLKSKAEVKELSQNCTTEAPNFRMISNIGGDRYEFRRCLPVGFTAEQIEVTRQGDSLLVKFKNEEAKGKRNLQMCTLDIDSYPRYHFITVGDETFQIVTSN